MFLMSHSVFICTYHAALFIYYGPIIIAIECKKFRSIYLGYSIQNKQPRRYFRKNKQNRINEFIKKYLLEKM